VDWPWLKPYLADAFDTPNARDIRDRSFCLYLNENYGVSEASDCTAAIVKVETSSSRARLEARFLPVRLQIGQVFTLVHVSFASGDFGEKALDGVSQEAEAGLEAEGPAGASGEPLAHPRFRAGTCTSTMLRKQRNTWHA